MERFGSLRRSVIAVVWGIAATTFQPSPATAQRDSLPVGPDGEPLVRAVRLSKLRLPGNADVAVSDLRNTGFFKLNSCAENYNAMADCFALYQSTLPNGQESGSWFELSWRWGVPKTDWDRARARAPSLDNVTLGPSGPAQAGWTVNDYHQSGTDDIGAGDGSLGLHHSGAVNTADGSCLDHANSWGIYSSPGIGASVLAGSNCPETWGTEGWRGARPVPIEVYRSRYDANPAGFTFDFWRVSEQELTAAGVAPPTTTRPGRTIGYFQTYGYTSDHAAQILCGAGTIRSYGSIIPAGSPTVPSGCSGNPTRPGWPLGIELRFDAFTFREPALRDILFFQVLVINRSQDVYGTGLDYDSLYVDLRNGWYQDRGLFYHVPSQGAIYHVSGPIQPCQAARQVVDLTCATWGGVGVIVGFRNAARAVIILKSPIGDLRNKLFSHPNSPFYNPSHALAGDTLTYNHGHLCGFRSCNRNTTSSNPTTTPEHERWSFGLISSTEQNVLANRTSTSLGGTVPGQNYWHLFRAAGFGSYNPDCYYGEDPTLGMCWNRYVPPGNWDYNHDGILDTLHLDGCFLTGCAGLWSDSLPAITGIVGKMPTYGNIGGVLGVGPIKLRAGDTTAFVVAITQARDSAGIMAQVAAAIDNYLNFFLAPDLAPACRFTGVSRATPPAEPSVTLSWNTTCFPGQWTDPFLTDQYRVLMAADTATPLGRIRRLNPWLPDSLLYLSTHNLANLYLFKSCDGGTSWTSDADCAGNPLPPLPVGPLQELGFVPYASFPVTRGSLDTVTYADRNVLPGLSYTYALVGETHGANFIVDNGDAVAVNANGDSICTLNCRNESLALAPVLLNPLSAEPGDPNVARVYLALSRQAGGRAARIEAVDSAGPMSVARLAITVTSDTLTPAMFDVRFADSAQAVELATYDRASRSLRERRDSLTLFAAGAAQAPIVSTTVYDTVSQAPLAIDTIRFGGVTSGGTVGAVSSAVLGGDSIVTTQFDWATGPVLALVRAADPVAKLTGGPLLVSNLLSGTPTTPAEFHSNPDYPNFDISVDNTLAGRFDRQFFTNADGSRVPGIVEPTVTWQRSNATRNPSPPAASEANGEYLVAWLDKPFGPGEQFRLDPANPSLPLATIQSSLVARAVAGIGATDTATERAIAQFLGVPSLAPGSLEAVKLPFTIANRSYNRPVTVAMFKRTAGYRIVFGLDLDTLWVPVPSDIWVPGDRLYLIETIGGVPRATFAITIGCGSFTRQTCNPLYPLTTGATTYLGEKPGQVNHVLYDVPVTPASRFTLRTVAPLRGTALLADGAAVRAGLAGVRVVPNPYVMLSQYPRTAIAFTHMPPRGVLRIYTVSGQFVQQITWTEKDLGANGDLTWNLQTRENAPLASGLYVYVLTARDASDRPVGSKSGKFVVVR